MLESSAVDTTMLVPSEALAVLQAVADPIRYAILDELAGRGCCVCDLQERIEIAPNLLSYHLRVLREAGLITGTRRGRWVDYCLAPGALDRMHAALPAPRLAGCQA
jgi:ArsR family transcriptional regulator